MNSIQTYLEGSSSDPGIGFSAQSVTIDNYSASWLWVVSAGRYVPPWTWGAVFSVNGSQEGSAAWNAPPFFSEPFPSGGIAYATWTDDVVAQSNGISIPPQSLVPVLQTVVLDNLSVPAAGPPVSVVNQVPGQGIAVLASIIQISTTMAGNFGVTLEGEVSGIAANRLRWNYAAGSSTTSPPSALVPPTPILFSGQAGESLCLRADTYNAANVIVDGVVLFLQSVNVKSLIG
jgi:hypothetical protein